MVLLSLLRPRTKSVASFLLRHGLRVRYEFLIRKNGADNVWLDRLCLLPIAQDVATYGVRSDAHAFLERRAQRTREPTKLDAAADAFWERIFGPDDDDDDENVATLDEVRVRSLEAHVLPALFPTGRWSDRVVWSHNHRFVGWLRREFLLARHAGSVGRTLSRNAWIRDYPDALPTAHELRQAFGTTRWSRARDDRAGQRPFARIVRDKLGGRTKENPRLRNRLVAVLDEDAVVRTVAAAAAVAAAEAALGLNKHKHKQSNDSAKRSKTKRTSSASSLVTLEDALELAGGHVVDAGPFNVYCEERGVFEFRTAEHVKALADYLVQRTRNEHGDVVPTVVLEVGAGDGSLTRHLSEACVDRTHMTFVATDDGSWGVRPRSGTVVRRADAERALAELRDDDKNDPSSRRRTIVLCSWMPKGVDWTATMRRYGVDEYVLIGETDDGSCGHNWYTWGNPAFAPRSETTTTRTKGAKRTPTPTPYEVDGYERVDLERISRTQHSRYDSRVSRSGDTVSFRRTRDARVES